jgi:transcription antitermination protein NusB
MSPTQGKNPAKPNKRREGREAALQLLYSQETLPPFTPEELHSFWEMRNADTQVRTHAEALWRGYLANKEEIDKRITTVLENFSFERLASVDRNILRIAVFEMFHDTRVPPIVSLNEAMEVAKRFGGEDSAKFINGVLDKLLPAVTRQHR